MKVARAPKSAVILDQNRSGTTAARVRGRSWDTRSGNLSPREDRDVVQIDMGFFNKTSSGGSWKIYEGAGTSGEVLQT